MSEITLDSYEAMWESLGLDLEAHDQLLKVLGGFYQDIYLTQKDRPAGMKYLDMVIGGAHGLRIQELMNRKAAGDKVIGTYCVFVPEEMVMALGGVQVGLCAGAEIGFAEAEKYLPRNTCALIKSFFGFSLAKVCPYVEACDAIIGETTCDGKKKAYEIFGEMKPVYVMEVPHLKSEMDRTLWLFEVKRLRAFLEKTAGREMTAENLRSAIETVNAKRSAVLRVMALRGSSPVPISGKDALLINQVAFYDDAVRFTAHVDRIADELEGRIKAGEGVAPKNAKRILVSGCPMAIPNWKLHHLVESAGAVIVGEESCVGMRNVRNLVSTDGATVDALLENIVDRYFEVDCACFSPNDERLDHIVEMARNLEADGVIHYNLQFCTPYAVESYKVEKRLEKEGIPVLRIETDYGMEDSGQLGTRVQAFLEMLS